MTNQTVEEYQDYATNPIGLVGYASRKNLRRLGYDRGCEIANQFVHDHGIAVVLVPRNLFVHACVRRDLTDKGYAYNKLWINEFNARADADDAWVDFDAGVLAGIETVADSIYRERASGHAGMAG